MRRITITGLVVLVALLALPVAEGAKPIRDKGTHPEPVLIPAGFGCAFDVLREVSPDFSFQIFTDFSDGRSTVVGHGNLTLTNLDTGTSYEQKSRYQFTDVYDEATNTAFSDGGGRYYFNFYPGDQGPFGEVGENGALYLFVGSNSLTFDLDTELITSFSYTGTVTDLCAILAAE